MGQRARPRMLPIFFALVLVITNSSCDRADSAAAVASTQPAKITVASLVPAATDLLIGMGAGDRLVAVSNFDAKRGATRALPRVGDYQTIDWERLASLRPNIMIT